MTTGLFSTYRQGENRVTSTFLAVLQRLSLSNIDRILQGVLGESSYQLFRFENQPMGQASVPDARLAGSPALWVETKTTPGSVDPEQVESHLQSLSEGERLLLLTPDDENPFTSDDRVVWSSFRTLDGAIQEVLKDPSNPPAEQEGFLLREFVSMLAHDGLLDSPRSLVLVVAARNAWPEYEALSAYICQPRRSFQKTEHVAFYFEGRVQKLVPKIESVVEELLFTDDGIVSMSKKEDRSLATELLGNVRRCRQEREGETYKVLFLTDPNSSATTKLDSEIVNDQRVPFTYGHRYVRFEALEQNPKTTSELLRLQDRIETL